MKGDEATLLLRGFIDSLPNNKQEIHDYISQNGIDMSDHAFQGRKLPEGFTGFFYSSEWNFQIHRAMWLGYVENGTGIFYTFIKSSTAMRIFRGRAKTRWEVQGVFYDITNLVIAKPQGNFMNWIDENPLEVKG